MRVEQSYSKNWLNLIILLGLYFCAVRAAQQKEKGYPDVGQMFHNFVVCNNDNTRAWCMTLGKELNQEFQSCIESIPELQVSLFPQKQAMIMEVPHGMSALNHAEFLNCFFSQETAMFRKALVQPKSTFGFLEDAIICTDHENAAHCSASDEKRRKKLVNCLQNSDDLEITFSSKAPTSFKIVSESPIRQTASFQQCFFNEEFAIALRRVTSTGLASFFKRDHLLSNKVNARSQFRQDM